MHGLEGRLQQVFLEPWAHHEQRLRCNGKRWNCYFESKTFQNNPYSTNDAVNKQKTTEAYREYTKGKVDRMEDASRFV